MMRLHQIETVSRPASDPYLMVRIAFCCVSLWIDFCSIALCKCRKEGGDIQGRATDGISITPAIHRKTIQIVVAGIVVLVLSTVIIGGGARRVM